jgi:hypothetical protein
MSDKRFHIVCTGGGQHGRIAWSDVILHEDGGIREERTRQEPLAAGQTRRKAVVLADSHRTRKGWRWRCPKCHLDKPLSDDHLRAWMNVTTGDTLDLSKLPR